MGEKRVKTRGRRRPEKQTTKDAKDAKGWENSRDSPTTNGANNANRKTEQEQPVLLQDARSREVDKGEAMFNI